MNVLLLSLSLAAPPERPEPQPVAAGALPAGVVARLGPDAFRYAGTIQVLHNAGPTVWYSPDGKRLAATANTGAYVWDAGTGKRLLWVPTDAQALSGFLGFGTNNDVLVDCRRKWDDGGAGVFRIDLATGKVTAKFQPTEERRFAAVSPDGKVAFSFTRGNGYQTETVADEIDSGKELWRRKDPLTSWLRVSPDGSRVVVWTSSAEWTAAVLDSATGKTVGSFAHEYTPTWTGGGLAVGPKAGVVVSAHAWDHGFSVFGAGTEKPAWREGGTWHENAFVTADGKKAVLVNSRSSTFDVEVWDLAAKKPVSLASAKVGRTMALSPDGTTLAAAADYGMPPNTLHFFDVATGKRRAGTQEPFEQAAVVWYLPDGTLASADEKFAKPVKWDVKTGAMAALPVGTKPPAEPKPGKDFKPPEGTTNVAVSPDGNRAVGYRFDPDELDSSPGDTYIGLFDGTGRVLERYGRPDHTDGAWYRFAPDGRTFAVARGDGTITLFDSVAGKELRTLRHGGGVSSLAFSPDGKFLATACGDGPILVWDVSAK